MSVRRRALEVGVALAMILLACIVLLRPPDVTKAVDTTLGQTYRPIDGASGAASLLRPGSVGRTVPQPPRTRPPPTTNECLRREAPCVCPTIAPATLAAPPKLDVVPPGQPAACGQLAAPVHLEINHVQCADASTADKCLSTASQHRFSTWSHLSALPSAAPERARGSAPWHGDPWYAQWLRVRPPARGARVAPPPRGFTILGVDAHRGPRTDTAEVLARLGHRYIDWSFQVQEREAVALLMDGAPPTRSAVAAAQARFFDDYRFDSELLAADAFMCSFDPHFCYLFLPFGKPIIMNNAYRLEGHHSETTVEGAKLWWEEAMRMGDHPNIVFAATNYYDAMYTHHFTGSYRVVPLLAVGDYVFQEMDAYACSPDYKPADNVIYFGANRNSDGALHVAQELMEQLATVKEVTSAFTFALLKEKFGGGFLTCRFPEIRAVVYFGYSVHSYFDVDLAAAGVPVLVPTARYMAELHAKWKVYTERQTKLYDADPTILDEHNRSIAAGHSPYQEGKVADIAYWLQFSDPLFWPAAIRFDSVEELAHLLRTTDFAAAAAQMRRQHIMIRQRTYDAWEHIMRYLFTGATPRARIAPETAAAQLPESLEAGLEAYRQAATVPTFTARSAPRWERAQNTPSASTWLVAYLNGVVLRGLSSLAAALHAADSDDSIALVVVADVDAPSHWDACSVAHRCVYLSHSALVKLPYRTVSRVHTASLARKNLGYLFALHHGAQIIVDVPADAVLGSPPCVDAAQCASMGMNELRRVSRAVRAALSLPVQTLEVHSDTPLVNALAPFTSAPPSDIAGIGECSTRKRSRSEDAVWLRGHPPGLAAQASSLLLCNQLVHVGGIALIPEVTRGRDAFQSIAHGAHRWLPHELHADAWRDRMVTLRRGDLAVAGDTLLAMSSRVLWLLWFAPSVPDDVSPVLRDVWMHKLAQLSGTAVAYALGTQSWVLDNHLREPEPLGTYDTIADFAEYMHVWSPRASWSPLQSLDGLAWDLAARGFLDRQDAEAARAWLLDLADLSFQTSG